MALDNMASNAIQYRHSTMCSGNAGWTASPESHTQMLSKAKIPDTEVEINCCEHNQEKFGLHPHQVCPMSQFANFLSGL